MRWNWWERRKAFLSKPQTQQDIDNAKKYFGDSMSILGFLGGVALAALVLMLQEKTAIETNSQVWIFSSEPYFQFLVGLLAMVSVICVIACSLAQRIAAGWIPVGAFSWRSAYWLHNISYLTFLSSLPFVLLPFAPWAALGVLVVGSAIGLVTVVIPFFRGSNLWSDIH